MRTRILDGFGLSLLARLCGCRRHSVLLTDRRVVEIAAMPYENPCAIAEQAYGETAVVAKEVAS